MKPQQSIDKLMRSLREWKQLKIYYLIVVIFIIFAAVTQVINNEFSIDATVTPTHS